MDEGGGNFPKDIQEAISFMTHRSTQEIIEFRQEAIANLARRADDLMPDLVRIEQRFRQKTKPLK